MPPHPIRERLLPYKVLGYLLYGSREAVGWVESLGRNQVRVYTPKSCRALRMKNSSFWEALYWLVDMGLVDKVEKEKKRGTAIITLKLPTNIKFTVE